MKVLSTSSWINASILLSGLSSGFAINGKKQPQLTKRDGSKVDNFVKFKFDKYYGDSYKNSSKKNRPKLDIVKRDGYEEIELKNESSFYSINLSIGTPAQNVTVLLDTGSSDLWVTGSDNPLCSSSDATITDDSGDSQSSIDCDEYGTFTIDDSSTYSANGTSFSITYGDGSYALGNWGQDVLSLQDIDVTGLSFAVANYTNSTVGVLGIGLPTLEVTYSGTTSLTTNPYTYDNLPLVLKNSGAIKSYTYSLFLNSDSAKEGSILFGGIDHSKYEGSLYTIPLVNYLKSSGFSKPTEFDITLQGLGVSNSTKNSTVSTVQVPALLDSGTTLTYLPYDLVSLLANQLGASYSSRLGYFTMACPHSSDNTQIVFDFGGFHINTDLSSFIVGSSMNVCILGIIPRDGAQAILGDSFLQHAYVVYDLENLEISLAQAKFTSTKEDIEPIVSTVPSAIRAASYSNTWSTTGTITGGGNIFTVTPVASNSTSSTSSRSSSTSSSSSSRRSSTNASSSSDSKSSSSASSLRPSSTQNNDEPSSYSRSSTSSTTLSESTTSSITKTSTSTSSSSSTTTSTTSTSTDSNKSSNGIKVLVPSFSMILACFLCHLI